MIKAIDTIYDGHKFRSRLEARWAVFFNKARIEYRYELEGYTLPFKINYLPDFLIKDPDYGWCFAEVKPTRFTAEEYFKCAMLCSESNKRVILFEEEPFYGMTYWMIAPVAHGYWHNVTNEVWGFSQDRHWYEKACEEAALARFEFGETPL